MLRTLQSGTQDHFILHHRVIEQITDHQVAIDLIRTDPPGERR